MTPSGIELATFRLVAHCRSGCVRIFASRIRHVIRICVGAPHHIQIVNYLFASGPVAFLVNDTIRAKKVLDIHWTLTTFFLYQKTVQYGQTLTQIYARHHVGCAIFVLHGVFKKRPNFLNSTPTSKERALRLLRAPSVRF